MLTSHSASAASKGETPGNSDPKNCSMEEVKVPVPGANVSGNPLLNQTSIVPAGSNEASATLELGRSERSSSNAFETP